MNAMKFPLLLLVSLVLLFLGIRVLQLLCAVI